MKKTIIIVVLSFGLAILFAVAAKATGDAWLYVLAVVFIAPIWFARPILAMQADKERAVDQKGNQVRVDVNQNGPFETEPAGSDWYDIGSRIELKAFPREKHPFRLWTSNTNTIEIMDPTSVSTWAVVKGPGTITANFY